MWEDNLEYYPLQPELMDNLQKDKVKMYIAGGGDVPFNSPSGSWQQIIYPFSTDKELRKKYQKFDTGEI